MSKISVRSIVLDLIIDCVWFVYETLQLYDRNKLILARNIISIIYLEVNILGACIGLAVARAGRCIARSRNNFSPLQSLHE